MLGNVVSEENNGKRHLVIGFVTVKNVSLSFFPQPSTPLCTITTISCLPAIRGVRWDPPPPHPHLPHLPYVRLFLKMSLLMNYIGD